VPRSADAPLGLATEGRIQEVGNTALKIYSKKKKKKKIRRRPGNTVTWRLWGETEFKSRDHFHKQSQQRPHVSNNQNNFGYSLRQCNQFSTYLTLEHMPFSENGLPAKITWLDKSKLIIHAKSIIWKVALDRVERAAVLVIKITQPLKQWENFGNKRNKKSEVKKDTRWSDHGGGGSRLFGSKIKYLTCAGFIIIFCQKRSKIRDFFLNGSTDMRFGFVTLVFFLSFCFSVLLPSPIFSPLLATLSPGLR